MTPPNEPTDTNDDRPKMGTPRGRNAPGHSQRNRSHRMYREEDPRRNDSEYYKRRKKMRDSFFRRDSHREVLDLTLLELLSDRPKGITGYQIQAIYNIPRGNLLRTLDKLESEKCISYEETIENGRTQKKYLITEAGLEYLDKLREIWAVRGEFIDELAPFEEYGFFNRAHYFSGRHRRPPFNGPHGSPNSPRRRYDPDHPPRNRRSPPSHPPSPPRPPGAPLPPEAPMPPGPPGRPMGAPVPPPFPRRRPRIPLDQFQSKEDVIDFLRGERSRVSAHVNRLNRRLGFITRVRDDLNELIASVEAMDGFSQEKIRALLFPLEPLESEDQS